MEVSHQKMGDSKTISFPFWKSPIFCSLVVSQSIRSQNMTKNPQFPWWIRSQICRQNAWLHHSGEESLPRILQSWSGRNRGTAPVVQLIEELMVLVWQILDWFMLTLLVFYWCCFLMIENSITSEKNWKKKKKTLFGAALVRWPSCCWLLIIYAAVSAGNMVSSKIWASVRMQRMQLISEWEYI